MLQRFHKMHLQNCFALVPIHSMILNVCWQSLYTARPKELLEILNPGMRCASALVLLQLAFNKDTAGSSPVSLCQLALS